MHNKVLRRLRWLINIASPLLVIAFYIWFIPKIHGIRMMLWFIILIMPSSILVTVITDYVYMWFINRFILKEGTDG